MRKFITLALSLFTIAVMANPVDKKVTEQIAVNQYAHFAPSNISDYTVANVFETTYNGVVTFYTYTFKSGGFVIVAADDASIPVLGYSHEGNVDPDAYNPSAKAWFEDYSRAISEISNSKLSNTTTRPLWDNILNNNMERSMLDVAPLVTTTWDQGCYYNTLCPADAGAGYGACGHTYTGCVATTMAVIMKYNQWPVNGVGYHTYTDPAYGVQTANFAAATYDYAAMPAKVTTANAEVAKLMYHCGVAVNMSYGTDGSGAFSEDVPFAMINYFNYNTACHRIAQEDYTLIDDWYALLRADLDASHPIYYSGSSSAGGHAFICDGYRLSDNKFHFNWGWSGSYNGYFAIGALNPGGSNFNENNAAIIGCYPGNNATAWIAQNTHFTAASRGIQYMHAVDEQVAWATAYDGAAKSTTINEFTLTNNGGETWTTGQVKGGTTYGLGNICALNGEIAYVTLYNGVGNQDNTCGIYKTSNHGLTWQQLPGALQGSTSFANNVYFWNEQEGMCHGDVKDGYFEIYTTVDGGTTWQRVPKANITGGTAASGEGGWTSVIEATGENTIMFGSNKGKVYISDDRGFTWRISSTNITPVSNGGINAISFTDPMHGLVAQTQTPVKLCRTSDGGATWENITPTGPFLTNDLMSVPGSNGTYLSTGAATGATGISYSLDAGSTWTMFPATDHIQFLGGDYASSTCGYAGSFNTDANNGGMYRMIGSLGVAPGPQISTDPSQIAETTQPDQVVTAPLSIINHGDADLTWTITLTDTPAWLSVDQAAGTTAAGETTLVTVTLDATSLVANEYTSSIVIANNSATPIIEIPVSLTVATQGGNNLILDFEPYADFTLSIDPWTNLDVDGSVTWGIQDVTFPHAGEPMAFIVFNPLTTTPPISGMETHGGERLGVCMASQTPPNNDYLISPKLLLGDDAKISMWVKSYTDKYGLEEYNVLVSTTDMSPASFQLVAGPIEAPADAWTNVEYDLSAYTGQQAYVAIQCVSNDKFMFMVDDISITFSTGTHNMNVADQFRIYPNPANDMLNINGKSKIISLSLINTNGQVVLQSNVNSTDYSINVSNVPTGLYMLRLTTNEGVMTSKVSIK